LYTTNLPCWMVDCLSAQCAIFRTNNCFFAARHKDTGRPYFAGYEDCNGCCPLNCTQVWNYAKTHARLFPELGRNMRWYDFNHYMKEDGEIRHRQHADHGASIDGQCAVIVGAYREYLLSPDNSFLREIWPNVRKAVEWLIREIDADEDGVNAGAQLNTYDATASGAHAFIGSQYLAALAAGEKMALVMGDPATAARWATIRHAGMEHQDALLYNGSYFIQVPDETPARDYNNGCHSDQLLGQWWAHMLDLGRLYPEEHLRSALSSIFRYNFRTDLTGFEQRPRRFVIGGEGGLLNCTWPRGDRPEPFIGYADEVWTGVEYATAGLMIYEGLLNEAFEIVHTTRTRYDGRLREGLSSGPGGNPFNDLECGRFYARALSSWSLLLAAQGFVYEGPAARIGFLPKWRPEDHQSFFCAAEGWGVFRQKSEDRHLQAWIDVRYGKVGIKEIVLGRLLHGEGEPEVELSLDSQPLVVAGVETGEDRTTVRLQDHVQLSAGLTMRIRMDW
ncbi:MAG: glycoside hydrolase family 116 protein, partial [Planctomycetes bacterium]|nr:glycoside hydrolase family 116 protein [Planctomycetota bacterium]